MSFAMRAVWLFFLLRKKLGMAKIGRPARPPAKPTKRQLKNLQLSRTESKGFEIYKVSPTRPRIRIVYLHGGGYVQSIASQHWDFIGDIARRANAEIVVPHYGLSPRYKVDDALELMDWLQAELTTDLPIILMGDSAGGGLALVLAQRGWKCDGLILISPWVDSEFGEGFDLYQKRDPWLNADSLKYIATVWSGVGDYRRLEVSPLRASMANLPPSMIFAGDFELFYPDLIELAQKMRSAGCEVELKKQPGGLHVFPLIPSPEALSAREEVVEFLQGI